MSRSLMPENYRPAQSIRGKEPGTYGYFQAMANEHEQSGHWGAAEALWIKAKHRAPNTRSHDWAYHRALFCRCRKAREQGYFGLMKDYRDPAAEQEAA